MAVASYTPEPAAEVLVVRTGTANLASVLAGLRRAGASPELTSDAGAVRAATHVMLPGVGAFAASMQRLREQGLEAALRERVSAGRPTLAICVGLQLLCDDSEESPGTVGLGVVHARVTRFASAPGVRVPQLGWNYVQPESACRVLEPGYAYFANSYRLVASPPGWHAAYSDHGGPFVAAMERGAVLACQFHPELSGAWGLRLIRRWLECAQDLPHSEAHGVPQEEDEDARASGSRHAPPAPPAPRARDRG